eukprot:COSAG02_NODE_3110_length_7343_cov_14.255936_9_plen_76_part_00
MQTTSPNLKLMGTASASKLSILMTILLHRPSDRLSRTVQGGVPPPHVCRAVWAVVCRRPVEKSLAVVRPQMQLRC